MVGKVNSMISILRKRRHLSKNNKKVNIWVRERTEVIDIINSVKTNEMVLGRAY